MSSTKRWNCALEMCAINLARRNNAPAFWPCSAKKIRRSRSYNVCSRRVTPVGPLCRSHQPCSDSIRTLIRSAAIRASKSFAKITEVKVNFFSELKRRNVYKVAVAYAVVGWLLAQIATQIFPFLEIPNWVVRLVIVLIAIGFPIALVIAWAFEATPEG